MNLPDPQGIGLITHPNIYFYPTTIIFYVLRPRHLESVNKPKFRIIFNTTTPNLRYDLQMALTLLITIMGQIKPQFIIIYTYYSPPFILILLERANRSGTGSLKCPRQVEIKGLGRMQTTMQQNTKCRQQDSTSRLVQMCAECNARSSTYSYGSPCFQRIFTHVPLYYLP